MFGDLAKFAGQSTAYQTKQREKIMPGSQEQFRLASNQLQQMLQGEVPQDVVDFTNRTVAQRTGGSFNPWTGGGRSQPAFARSIGQLSTDMVQRGLSAAPTWQQLANSFVTPIGEAFQYANALNQTRYRYDALGTEVDMFNATQGMANAENYYRGAQNSATWQQNIEKYNAQQDAMIPTAIGGLAENLAPALRTILSQYSAPGRTYMGTAKEVMGINSELPVYRPGGYRVPGGNEWYRAPVMTPPKK